MKPAPEQTCCGLPVDKDTGRCQHRSHHPRHVTGRMIDRMTKAFDGVGRDYGTREGVKAVLVALFTEDAKEAGYEPAKVTLCTACFTGWCVVGSPDDCSGGDCKCDHKEERLMTDE